MGNIMPQSRYVRYHAEEWSALYVDGKLDTVGDTYLSDERISQLLGVEEHEDDDSFLRGGNSRSDVAKTLEELETYAQTRNNKLQQAAALRAEAAKLEAQAASLLKS